ncbi:MAG: sigma-70 family RNA polymerase sigma factor [Exilispira sp.]|jgi:RNA polymerase primary sigma factor|nr:sigma-70 family RNA polymerase sigma factor [Exilispira sp.]
MIKEATVIKINEMDYENDHSYTNYIIDYNKYFDNYLDFEDKDNEKEIQYVENDNSSNDDKDYLLRTYLQDIKKVPLLTREEEIELAKKAKEGDEKAKEKIVAANLRFVVSVAKQYQNQGMSLMDLIAEGNIGLLNAVERFDPDAGNHFISYAVWWIRQSIMKALSEKTRTIRLPLNQVSTLFAVEKAEDSLISDGENISIKKIAEKLNISDDKVATIINAASEIESLDMPVSDNAVFGDIIPDNSETPLDMALKMDIKDIVNVALSSLSDKERKIIKLRFGLYDGKEMSLLEIGKRFNLTKERIRQIEKRALQKIMNCQKLSEFHQEYVA